MLCVVLEFVIRVEEGINKASLMTFSMHNHLAHKLSLTFLQTLVWAGKKKGKTYMFWWQHNCTSSWNECVGLGAVQPILQHIGTTFSSNNSKKHQLVGKFLLFLDFGFGIIYFPNRRFIRSLQHARKESRVISVLRCEEFLVFGF